MRKFAVVGFVVALLAPAMRSATADDPGRYLTPFREDGATFDLAGNVTPRPGSGYDANGCKPDNSCLPAGATVVQLADGRLLYWNALENTEKIDTNAVLQGGHLTVNDQSRLLTLGAGDAPSWAKPSPVDTDTHNTEHPDDLPLPGPLAASHYPYNNGSLFCSDQVLLAGGQVLDAGGTDYYDEPTFVNGQLGVIELQGIRQTRIFDPANNTWRQAAPMKYGRWYPSLVTLPDGHVFVAGGVEKLIKPLYPSHPADSGRNVRPSETYDPAANAWTENGTGGERALPLFPRLHLLPDGHVYYDAAGQTFDPAGESWDEVLWNMAGSYDPATKTWTDLGIPGAPSPIQGYRGSTFSAALPLRPVSGAYPKASFLSAGGVLFPTPGSWVAVADSRINTVSIGADGKESLSQVSTGPLAKGRWYGAAVPLPDGTVYAVNGADTDEVLTPGYESPIKDAELFTPNVDNNGNYTGGSWRPVGTEARKRTYHNTAILLPDGRVLIGGNAPIPSGYNKVMDGPDLPGRPGTNNHHDASFQIYEPPYWSKPRPTITNVNKAVVRGSSLTIATPDAEHIASVVLIRNTAQTHLVDGDARSVMLPITKRSNGSVQVDVPGGTVLPAGPYLLYVNQNRDNVNDDKPGHVVPSKGVQVMVGDAPPKATPLATPAFPARARTASAGTSHGATPGSHDADPPTRVRGESAQRPSSGGGTLAATGASIAALVAAALALVAAGWVLRRRRRPA